MKKAPFIILLFLTFVLEVVGCLYWIGKMERVKQDPVAINECLHSITEHFGEETQYKKDLPYVVMDQEGKVVYQTEHNMSQSINEAIKNNDLILDLVVNEEVVGKIIFDNTTAEKIEVYRNNIVKLLLVVFMAQALLILAYFLYCEKYIIAPFKKLNAFAVRVAGGNLDLPLELDRKHIFGSFTESFDLMRNELKKARIAEKKANDDKKEMIAKLSHDIKTPVASIKSTSEFGFELTKEERTKEMFNLINVKSDQITTLVDNLFNSSVNDITEIAVNPSNYNAEILNDLITNSDYLHKAGAFTIPMCNIYCDKLRLQQAFDNIFMNSYKYANTDISVDAYEEGEYLVIKIADFGDGVLEEELPLLKEKYRRGSNIIEKDGAGLGLYLTNYFLEKMDGKLVLKNENPGFVAFFYLRKI